MEYTANPLMDSVFTSLRYGDVCGDNKQILPGAGYPDLLKPDIKVDWTVFHTFTLEWTPSALTFLIDGQVILVNSKPEFPVPQDPFYLILNSAVAWYYPPAATTPFPAYHTIKSVRVYRWKEASGEGAMP